MPTDDDRRGRPPAPLKCRRCGSMNVRVTFVDPDPDLLDDLLDTDPELAAELAAAGLAATVWRVRACRDCGRLGYSAEIYVDGRLARSRLSALRLWRAGSHPAGWRESTARETAAAG